MPSPLFSTIPRPHCPGIRPKRSCPRGVLYSAHTRWTLIEFVVELTPAVGGPCVFERKLTGANRLYPADTYPFEFVVPFVPVDDVANPGCIAYALGVEPRTRLSSAKISV